jgi:Uma2 family endonuclease
MAGVPTIDTGPMTVEDFFLFTDSRPDNEKWELIDGEPILNASASQLHQRIIFNLSALFAGLERAEPRSWEASPGIGVRISNTDLPEPDFFIIPRRKTLDERRVRECRDMIVAFEILSPSTADRDLRWKRAAYTKLPSVTHYIVIAQDVVDVVVHDRSKGFKEQRYVDPNGAIDLASIGVTLPLGEIYRDLGVL